MKGVIYQDQRIAEEFCNLKCDYCEGFCPTGYSLKCDKNNNLHVPDEWFKKIEKMPLEVKKNFENTRKLSDFYELSYKIMNNSKKVVSADVLKISGGEITVYNKLADFVENVHKNYKMIQILTNGLIITNEDLERYRKMGNIVFQISLDGIDYKSNYTRTHNEKITKKILDNIDLILEYGFGVEINCVLTKYNISNFLDMLERYKNAKNFLIVPRPVRGEPKDVLKCSTEQLIEFENTIKKHYDEFKNILPPMEYFNRLLKMMIEEKREYRCYIPYFILSVDGYGNMEQCPCGLTGDYKYNLLSNEADFKNILLDSKYNIFKKYKECTYCMTQYELINLYIDGEITENDLKKVPSLNSEEIIRDIIKIKEMINMKIIKEIINDKYFDGDIYVERNEDSTDGNVYMIKTSNEKYVVKLYKTLQHTINMVRIHSLLNERKIKVPIIINTKDKGKYCKINENKYLVVYSFIEGEQIGWSGKYKRLSENLIKELADTVKKMHDTKVPFLNDLENVKYEENDLENEKSLLHFDLTRNNIFINNGKISIIDFDDAKSGNRICDISILIANLFFSKTYGADTNGVKLFLNEYFKDDMENIENKRKLIKKYALKWVDYILSGNEFDTSTTESFEVKKKLIMKNL